MYHEIIEKIDYDRMILLISYRRDNFVNKLGKQNSIDANQLSQHTSF